MQASNIFPRLISSGPHPQRFVEPPHVIKMDPEVRRRYRKRARLSREIGRVDPAAKGNRLGGCRGAAWVRDAHKAVPSS